MVLDELSPYAQLFLSSCINSIKDSFLFKGKIFTVNGFLVLIILFQVLKNTIPTNYSLSAANTSNLMIFISNGTNQVIFSLVNLFFKRLFNKFATT